MKINIIRPYEPQAKYKKSLLGFLAFIVMVVIAGHGYADRDLFDYKNKVYAAQNEQLTKDNTEKTKLTETLKEKLATSSQIHIDNKTKAVVEFYLTKYFGKEAPLAERVFSCESGLNPQTVHTNKPGLAADYGIAQINPIWHKDRFEKLTGADFYVGIYDIEMNIRYAKQLRDQSGWNQWTCSQLI